MILSGEEVRIKERIWVELNRDYWENLATKALREQNGETSAPKPQKRRKRPANKPRDASNAHGSTAAEPVRTLVTKSKKFSRKINYSAYDSLFGTNTIVQVLASQKSDSLDDAGLYRMTPDQDDKENDGPMVVVEEEGGGVGTGAKRTSFKTANGKGSQSSAPARTYSDEEPDLDGEADGEKNDDTWGVDDNAETFEQEVYAQNISSIKALDSARLSGSYLLSSYVREMDHNPPP